MNNSSIKKSFKQNFTMVQNEITEDNRISWASKGIYTYLISKKEGWKFNQNDLINRSKDGSTKVKTAIKELKENGYLEIKQVKDKKGKILRWEWIVYDYEQSIERTSYPQVGNPLVENEQVENEQVDKTPINNTDLNNTDFNNIKREKKEKNDNFTNEQIEEYILKQLKNNKRIKNKEGYRITIFNKIEKGDKRTVEALKRFIQTKSKDVEKIDLKEKFEFLNQNLKNIKIEVNRDILQIMCIETPSAQELEKIGKKVIAIIKTENIENRAISIFPIENIENVENFVNEHKIQM